VNLNLKERKLVLGWFDAAEECLTLSDQDLKLCDMLRESVEDDTASEDPLAYHLEKKGTDEESNYSDEYSYDDDDDADL